MVVERGLQSRPRRLRPQFFACRSRGVCHCHTDWLRRAWDRQSRGAGFMADDRDRADVAALTEGEAFLAREPMRDAEGAVRGTFVSEIAAGIEGGNEAFLRSLVGELHEADVGDLIEALDPDLRPRLDRTGGPRLRLRRADRGRRHRSRGNPRGTAAGNRRRGRARARFRRRGRTFSRTCPRRAGGDPRAASGLRARARSSAACYYPENSAGRRMQTEFIAVPPDWTVGQTIDYMRETPDLPERFYELYVVDEERKLRGAVALDRLLRTQAAGADRRVDGRGAPPRARHRGSGGGGAPVRALQPRRRAGGRRGRPAGRRAHLRRHRRRHRGGGRRGHPKALGGVGARRRAVGLGLDHRQGPLPLAVRQPADRAARLLGDQQVRGLDREDGGACGADADRRQHGRQCRHPDHDGGGARARDPRTDRPTPGA